MVWMLIALATVASMFLASKMAHSRGRSAKAWIWTTAFIGPLGPMVLYFLRERREEVTHA